MISDERLIFQQEASGKTERDWEVESIMNLEGNADEGDVTILCRRCAASGFLLHWGRLPGHGSHALPSTFRSYEVCVFSRRGVRDLEDVCMLVSVPDLTRWLPCAWEAHDEDCWLWGYPQGPA